MNTINTLTFRTWNSCKGLETLARSEFPTLAQAQQFTTPQGGPNRITCSDGREWMLGAHADSAPYWTQTAGPILRESDPDPENPFETSLAYREEYARKNDDIPAPDSTEDLA